ncbi:MAG: hypothetical protein H0U69_09415 [Trueperaceae bacterium]|nr:hypothetical protein [Trueperaceae bacterium]
MTALASVLLLAYAAFNAFGAWSIIRRRGGSAMGFMASAAVLVVAAVAVAFSHPAKVPFAVVGVLASSWVSIADARAAGDRDGAWWQVLRGVAGALVVAAVVATPTNP